MGIDLICDNTNFCCSYTYWGKIRTEIIKATFDYIKDKYNKDKELYGNLAKEDDNWIGDGSEYHYYMNNLLNLTNNVLEKYTTKIDSFSIINFIEVFNQMSFSLDIINALNYFDIGGLFALCHQSDNEGYYMPGNSLDICSLFDRIEPFVKKYESYSSIYIQEDSNISRLYNVFEHSHKTFQKVTIC